ncbi:MAG: hypothetical protein FJX65_05495 [Alphaproteobacteria bacterium]|nr:hypothetical protein [Alphaproteobacteria bacterium]
MTGSLAPIWKNTPDVGPLSPAHKTSFRVTAHETPLGVVEDLSVAKEYRGAINHVHVEVWKVDRPEATIGSDGKLQTPKPKLKLLDPWEWLTKRWQAEQP